MIRRRLYNPAQLSEDELNASFVARHDTLDELLLLLEEQKTGSPCQHALLIGPRGMGKTTLGLRFLYEISTTPELNDAWQPVAFHEESYAICGISDFWLTALHHLSRATEDTRWSRRADALLEDEKNPVRLAAYARAALTDFYQSTGKRLILFVENIDAIFAQFSDEREVHSLRASLMERSEIMLVGSANTVFGGISSHGEPFYEFFRLFILRGLTREETQRILQTFLESTGEHELVALITLEQGRLETIRRLTGGNPRLMALTCYMLVHSPVGDSFEVLERLIDEQTPYFKARIEELPVQARKVFHCLAEAWKPMLAREIAHVSKLGSSHASAQLKQLVAKGYVSESRDLQGKKVRYELADRFYNIYFLLRFSSAGHERLRRLVGFMQDVFGREAMRTMYSTTLKTLNDREMSATEAADWLSVVASYVESDDEFSPREPWRRRAVEVAEKLIGPSADVIDQINRVGWTRRGDALLFEQRFEDAAEAYRKATEEVPDDYAGWTGLGHSLIELNRCEEALGWLRHVTERVSPTGSLEARYNAAAALDAQARAFVKLGRQEDAIVSFERQQNYVRCDDPGPVRNEAASSFLRHGMLLSEAGRDEEAISVWDRSRAYFQVDDAPEVRRGATSILWMCARTLAELDRRSEAISAWKDVCNYVQPGDSVEVRRDALMVLKDFIYHLSKWERNDETHFYQKLLVSHVRVDDPTKLRELAVRTLSNRGQALATNQQDEEAIKVWREIEGFVRLDDPVEIRHLAAAAYGIMGQSLLNKERYEEAISARNKCVTYVYPQDPLESRQEIANALAGDGVELNKLRRYSEAEATCRAGIVMAPENGYLWRTLAVSILLSEKGGRVSEVEECLRRAVELAPAEPANMHMLSDLLAVRGEWTEALRWLEGALRISIKEIQYGERSWLIESLIGAIAAHQGSRVKSIMERVGATDVMEPLWYALRADLGEKVEPLPAEIADAVKILLEEFSTKRS